MSDTCYRWSKLLYQFVILKCEYLNIIPIFTKKCRVFHKFVEARFAFKIIFDSLEKTPAFCLLRTKYLLYMHFMIIMFNVFIICLAWNKLQFSVE